MIDIDHLRDWIGKSESKAEVATPALIERFNATFDLDTPTQEGGIAPLLIHFCLAPSVSPTSGLGSDGHAARGGFLPPVLLPRRMWAGSSLEFLDDICIGAMVRRDSTIRDVTIKEGRSGRLCFVTVDHSITADERLVIRERQDIVYRDMPGPSKAEAAKASSQHVSPGIHWRIVKPDPALLFRYSAITFNAHRIHYDSPYSLKVEAYPGLVVHGPLQATLLAQFASDLYGRRPDQFEFRSLSPLFDDAEFILNAEEDAEGMRLWIARAQGPIAMEARARWK